MAELTIVTKMGDEELTLKGVTLQEMLAIRAWTSYTSKDEWLQAFNADDALAIQAGFALAVWRKTGTKPRLQDLDFNLDEMDSRLVDETGQTVMVKFDLNDDGTLKVNPETNKPVVVLGEDGRPQWFYADSGEPVPPTEAAASTT